MIYTNLLPWRETLAEKVKKQFINLFVLIFILGLGIVAIWYGAMFRLIDSQEAINSKLKNAITLQDKKITEIKDLKDQIQVLVSRKKVVEGLQNNRNQATRIFEQIGMRLPDGVVIKSIKQTGTKIIIEGTALNNTLISKTMSSLESSDWLTQPVLIEIVGVDAKVAGGATIKASDFKIEIKYTNPEAVVPATSITKK